MGLRYHNKNKAHNQKQKKITVSASQSFGKETPLLELLKADKELPT
jgi:hypothetical protein